MKEPSPKTVRQLRDAQGTANRRAKEILGFIRATPPRGIPIPVQKKT